MRVRHIPLRDQPFVINEDHRLIGGAVGSLFPDRPLGQLALFRRGVFLRIVGCQLQRGIHRRTPHHVTAGATRRLFADIAVIQLGAVHVVVFDLNARIQRFEPLNQRSCGFGIRGGIHHYLALFLRAIHNFLIVGWIACRELSVSRHCTQYRHRHHRRADSC
ncbi:hypothetical protein D3C87_1579190 [compost metagenome]